jgi:carbohydrate-selective porin OprB
MKCAAHRQIVLAAALTAASATALADGANTSAPPSGDMLLLDSLGRVVAVPTNEVPAALQPAEDIGLERQMPNPVGGSSMPLEILQREGAGVSGFQFFPAHRPRLMPYLASQDDFGNTAIRPGSLFFLTPLEGPLQGGKYRLSEYGFRYSLEQTLTFVSMTDVKQGDSDLAYYTFNLKSKWAMFNAPDDGTAGWISSQVEAKTGLDSAGNTQSAKSNLGTVTDPTGIWSGVNGFRVPELAWQQSARQGEIVLVAGMVSQRNYIDRNAYADSGRSKFMNSALINSEVLPLAQYNFGLNLQWQPADEWYALAGASMGNAQAGNAPWADFSGDNWSLPGEIGYAPRDFLNLGPGVYRLQPFAAEVDGATGGGLCFNLQQQLGSQSPLAWFGRFGFGGSKVSAGASAQAGTGFVLQAPFKHLLLQRTSNDLLGVGFVWSEPSSTTKTVYHENEYVLETVYALQLTPTIKLQPDFQMIWDPAFHRDTSQAMVFQLQLAMAW